MIHTRFISMAIAAIFLAGICAGAKEIRKVQIIGNSIMKHGPNASLGWHGNYGMAASASNPSKENLKRHYATRVGNILTVTQRYND